MGSSPTHIVAGLCFAITKKVFPRKKERKIGIELASSVLPMEWAKNEGGLS
jgi:hypothetical protein